ncbi:hypothetical protein I5S53_10550 [Pseudomonas juntendi]|uniref:hypothetical protein n=1 Tax=Pseudomonas juntendi TaxID=2666183 RepID=UPI0018D93058|nr:hypothetical protein [Pseudomonas juntendi]MBH3384400.1 hypothetical protein [Pseudomonas juntendi]
MKLDLGWWKERWVWIAMILLIVVLGYVLFSTYAEKLPYVSNNHSAWASFGALLAGFFTLTSTLATVATLLFLARQNKGMQKVTQAQLAAMTFDRYISHRKLFIEILEEQEKSLGNSYKFRNPTLLYKAIFSCNSLHHCELTASPLFDENGDGANHLGKLCAKLERVKRVLANTDTSDVESHDFILDLIALRHDLLMVEQQRGLREGDVLFHGRAQGFNVFMLDNVVLDSVKVANIIFGFTNSPDIDGGMFHACPSDLKDRVLEGLYTPRKISGLTVHSGNELIADLVWVRSSLATVSSVDTSFVNAKRRLDEVFKSIQGVERLKDKVALRSLIESCLTDVKSKFDKMSEGEHFSLIAQIDLRLHNMKFNL